MFKLAQSLLLGATLLSMLSCSDQPTESETVKAQLYQIPGCGGHGLAKTAVGDSCFSYKFAQDLVVDFCVSANCCPDSQRFRFTHDIRHDTIFVAVTDTAANLCRCMCNYVIHAEFTDLPRDHYVFCCYYGEAMVYNEKVERPLL
jgi:hypothetical protein